MTKKIADCLSSIDDLIGAESEKLETYKEHKKGLMQKLFPSEDKTIPALRFPEFENEREWEEKAISSLIVQKASSLSLNKLDIKKNGYIIYGADGIIGKINSFQFDTGYISIVKDGAGVGRLRLCEPKSSILGTLSGLLSSSDRQFTLKWIYYLLQTIDFSEFISGSGIPHIYYKDYSLKKILIPNYEEQEKIADCLSSIDDLIAAQTEKIEQLKEHKKGLMQKLFPSLKEENNE